MVFGLYSMIYSAFLVNAEMALYPDQKILARDVNRIHISGVRGNIKLTGVPSKIYRLKVKHSRNKKYEDWSLAVDKIHGVLSLEVSSAAYGAQWRKTVSEDLWPEFDVELSGPAVPVRVSWREGNLEYHNWSASVESSHIKGDVKIDRGFGRHSVQMGQGDVKISKLNGDLELKGNAGEVTIAEVTGQVSVNWVAGDVTLKNVVGGGRVDMNEGELELLRCEGRWKVKVNKGEAKVRGCTGQLEAEGESAAWQVAVARDFDTEIKSLTGPVDIEWKSGSAKVFLTSSHGSIGGPKVESRMDPLGRSVAEFKIGEKPFTAVFVRTQSGPIVFKQ